MPGAVGVRFHPEAEREFLEAEAFYASRSEQAAEDFHDQLNRTLALILEAPERWALHRRGTRRLRVQQFPFSVVYRVQFSTVVIVAVAHGSRRPDYWSHRYWATTSNDVYRAALEFADFASTLLSPRLLRLLASCL